jgi:hypothetical protein
MSVVRPIRWEPGRFLRTCDVCGIRYRNDELVRGEDGFWRCITYCQEVPQVTRDKVAAQSRRRREAPPAPFGVPFDRIETYESEAKILWLLCEMPVIDSAWAGGRRNGLPPAVTLNVSGTSQGGASSTSGVGSSGAVRTAGEACRYLYKMIAENKRPTRWLTAARTKLVELADWLISRQVGFGQSPSSTIANDTMFGSMSDFGNVLTDSQAIAGMGLLAAYRDTGAAKYLASARAVASFLRNCQSIGACLANSFTSTDAAGTTRLYTGGIVHTIATGGSLRSNQQFHANSLVALEFWKELFTLIGDGNYGATGTVSGIFSTIPQALLSTMMADLRAFWSVGAFDVVTGTTYTGLSATTPREFFNAYPAVHAGFIGREATGSGSWEYANADAATGTTLTGETIAVGLGSLFAYEGYSAQVSSVWTWLMSYDSNPSFILAAGTLSTDFACVSSLNAANPPAPPVGQGNVVQPAYDPRLALTASLLVRDSAAGYAAIKMNGSSSYNWSTTGLMAAIQSSRNAGAFRTAKDTLSAVRLRRPPEFSDDHAISDYLTLRGTSGLSLQLGASVSATWSSLLAARAGNVYRYQPQSWTGSTQPQNQPGLQV